MIFYSAPGTIAVASHIALEESGLVYELASIDTALQEQFSERYRQINPKSRVPALIVNEQVLTETPAILGYIAQIAPSSVLALPEDPLAQAHIHSFNHFLCSTVHVAHAHKRRGARWTDNTETMASMTAYVPTSMANCYELLESHYFKGPWVHGEHFSISDPYLFAISQWLEGDGVDIAQFPKVQAHHVAMLKRASVQRVLVGC